MRDQLHPVSGPEVVSLAAQHAAQLRERMEIIDSFHPLPMFLCSVGERMYWAAGDESATEILCVEDSGRPRAIHHTEVRPLGLVADEAHLYWTEGARILRAAHDSKHHEVLAEGLPWAGPLAADSDTVYWAACSLGGTMGAIQKLSKSGGSPQVLGAITGRPSALTVSDTHVYWAIDRRVFAVPRRGGATAVVLELDAEVLALAAAGDTLYGATDQEVFAYDGRDKTHLCASGGEVLHIIAHGDELLWAASDLSGGSLYALQTQRPTRRTVMSGLSSPSHLRVTGAHLWWADTAAGQVCRVPLVEP